MNSRERVFKATKHEEPDHVPYNARLCKELAEAIQNEIPEGMDYRKYYKEDIMFIEIDFPEYESSDIGHLPLPKEQAVKKAVGLIKSVQEDGLIACNAYTPGVYEHIKEFLGDEYALVAMYENPDELMLKIEKVAEWLIKLNEINASIGYDICWIGDDIGAQKSLIMSPKNYLEFYKPYHKELVYRIKKLNANAKVAFHCCGHVTPLITELIDIGVDILETVQPEANNDLEFIKREFGRDITFWGAIGMQSVFSGRTPQEVEREVCKSLRIMSKGGGYIAAPCHTVTNDMTVDNVKAFYEALIKYGSYPGPGNHKLAKS